MKARKAGLPVGEGRKPRALLYKHLQSVVDNAISCGHVLTAFPSHTATLSLLEGLLRLTGGKLHGVYGPRLSRKTFGGADTRPGPGASGIRQLWI